MTLPTTEELNAKFNELSHNDIEYERVWFWYGIAAYCQLVAEQGMKDYEQFKAEVQKELPTPPQRKEAKNEQD